MEREKNTLWKQQTSKRISSVTEITFNLECARAFQLKNECDGETYGSFVCVYAPETCTFYSQPALIHWKVHCTCELYSTMGIFVHSILCSVQCIQFSRIRAYSHVLQHVHSAKVGHTHKHTRARARAEYAVQLPMAICFRQRQNHHYSRKYALTSLEAATVATAHRNKQTKRTDFS